MFKTLSVLFAALMLGNTANAQQTGKDTTVYYMKNSGFTVPDKSNADYVRYIMPARSINGVNYLPVADKYLNGNNKLLGFTTTNTNEILLAGECVRYYPNGNLRSQFNYQRGMPGGDITIYYPNGQLYIKAKFGTQERPFNYRITYLTECRDSTGKVLAANGEGKWLKFDDDFKNLLQEGPVSKGVENGHWALYAGGKTYDVVYNNGIPTTTDGYNLTGDIVAEPDALPVFKPELGTFDRFVWNNVKYPFNDEKSTTGGMVVLTFVVETDGNLSNFKVVRAPSKAFGQAALDVVKQSPAWQPGYVGGKPVRTSYTYAMKFTYGQK